jgi:putative transposase
MPKAEHHRKNIRLGGCDYSQAGGYFVTIVTQGRERLFGKIEGEEMILNEAGKMVEKWGKELSNKFPSVTADAFVVMPNHFHGIIFITVGADLRVGPGMARTLADRKRANTQVRPYNDQMHCCHRSCNGLRP